jgi:hypothetical protein
VGIICSASDAFTMSPWFEPTVEGLPFDVPEIDFVLDESRDF